MRDLQKVLHILVVLFFALVGIWSVLDGLGFAIGLKVVVKPDRFFQSEMDILFGIACLLAAAGLYRFDRRVRVFAILLTSFMLFVIGMTAILIPGIVMFAWLGLSLLVLIWLLLPTVRAQFAATRRQQKTA